jgi:hypothetical protein
MKDILDYLDFPNVRDARMGLALSVVSLAAISLIGVCLGLMLAVEMTYSAMRFVRKRKQREAKARYLAKLRAQSYERHRIKKRLPVNPLPTPEAIDAQWDRSHDSLREMISFGLLLLDVEPYVDNSLIFATGRDGVRRIVGREPGLRGWLAEHCPHVGYKTAMRYKSLAEKSRKVKDSDRIITKSTSAHQLQETLYRKLDIVHYKLEGPRQPRERMEDIPPNALPPGCGGHRHQSHIYRLRAQARDAMGSLAAGHSRRFVKALQNLAEEVRRTS